MGDTTRRREIGRGRTARRAAALAVGLALTAGAAACSDDATVTTADDAAATTTVPPGAQRVDTTVGPTTTAPAEVDAVAGFVPGDVDLADLVVTQIASDQPSLIYETTFAHDGRAVVILQVLGLGTLPTDVDELMRPATVDGHDATAWTAEDGVEWLAVAVAPQRSFTLTGPAGSADDLTALAHAVDAATATPSVDATRLPAGWTANPGVTPTEGSIGYVLPSAAAGTPTQKTVLVNWRTAGDAPALVQASFAHATLQRLDVGGRPALVAEAAPSGAAPSITWAADDHHLVSLSIQDGMAPDDLAALAASLRPATAAEWAALSARFQPPTTTSGG